MPAFLEHAPAARTVARAIDTLLESHWWPKEIESGSAFQRVEDDCDGDHTRVLSLILGRDGDAWIRTNGSGMLRFRNYAGGGMSLRVRNALLLLAEAMRRDEEARPQSRSSGDEDGAR